MEPGSRRADARAAGGRRSGLRRRRARRGVARSGRLPARLRQAAGRLSRHSFHDREAISERDLVAVRWTARMTHRGDQLGVAPTGNPVTVGGMSFVRVRDGKAVEAWNNWD